MLLYKLAEPQKMLVFRCLADVHNLLQLFGHLLSLDAFVIGVFELLFYQVSSEQKLVLLNQSIVPFFPASLAHGFLNVEDDVTIHSRLVQELQPSIFEGYFIAA